RDGLSEDLWTEVGLVRVQERGPLLVRDRVERALHVVERLHGPEEGTRARERVNLLGVIHALGTQYLGPVLGVDLLEDPVREVRRERLVEPEVLEARRGDEVPEPEV